MPSMSSIEDAYDNAMAESFFATLERELSSRRWFRSQAEEKIAVFERLEGSYNLPGAVSRHVLCWIALEASTSPVRENHRLSAQHLLDVGLPTHVLTHCRNLHRGRSCRF